MALDEIMGELAQYMRMQEEISQTVEALKDQLKQHMAAAGVDTLAGTEHKATYKLQNRHNRPKKGAARSGAEVHQNHGNPAFPVCVREVTA